MGGGPALLAGSPGLPAFVTPAQAGRGAAFDVALPSGAAGIEVRCSAEPTLRAGRGLTAYPVPSPDWKQNAVLGSAQRLGWVDARGRVTYSRPNTSGLSASRNRDGTLHVVVTAPAAGGAWIRSGATCAGVWFDDGTGANANETIGACRIHDNGYAGVFGGAGATFDGPRIENHTAVGIWRGGWGATSAKGVSVSGCYQGINGGRNAGDGTIGGCTFTDIADAAVRFEGTVDGDLVEGCTFGAPAAPCGTGIFVDAAIPPARRRPLRVENCAFVDVGTAIDENGGSQAVVQLGAGNTGL